MRDIFMYCLESIMTDGYVLVSVLSWFVQIESTNKGDTKNKRSLCERKKGKFYVCKKVYN